MKLLFKPRLELGFEKKSLKEAEAYSVDRKYTNFHDLKEWKIQRHKVLFETAQS